MRVIRSYWVCLVVIALLTSCSNFLDVKEQGKLMPEETDDYALLVHRILHQLETGESSAVMMSSDNVANLELFADDINANLIVSTSSDYLYAGMAINYNQKFYTDIYSVIKDCNIVIGGIGNKVDANSKNILGTVYAIRAICYYNLMRMYCVSFESSTADTDLGLQLVDEFNMEEKTPRSSLAETIEFIDNDFKTALQYECNDDALLFTRPVIMAHYARFNFWIERWQNAVDNALAVIDDYPLLPYDEYVDAMSARYPSSSNVIIGSATKASTMGSLLHNIAQQSVKRRIVSLNFAKLCAQLPATDIRRKVNYDARLITTKSVTSKFRSEELCLIIAESYAHLDNSVDALNYLNKLRINRLGSGYYPYSPLNLPTVYEQYITCDALGKPLTPLLSAILTERRMELFAEGDRWFELKRNGSPEFWVSTKGKKYINYQYLYTFAIPKRDVELIPNLLEQNEGYEK